MLPSWSGPGLFFYILTQDKKRCGSVPAGQAWATRLRKKSGKPGVEPIPDISFRFFIEPGDIILVVVDPRADVERDADHGDDRYSLVEVLVFHLQQILLGAA